jgi:hypothetical protein
MCEADGDPGCVRSLSMTELAEARTCQIGGDGLRFHFPSLRSRMSRRHGGADSVGRRLARSRTWPGMGRSTRGRFCRWRGLLCVCSKPGFAAHLSAWQAPILALCAGNSVVFWLFAQAVFDDGFEPRCGLWLKWARCGVAASATALRAALPVAGRARWLRLTP